MIQINEMKVMRSYEMKVNVKCIFQYTKPIVCWGFSSRSSLVQTTVQTLEIILRINSLM